MLATPGSENFVDVSKIGFSPSHETLAKTSYEKFVMTLSLTGILRQDEKNLFSVTLEHVYFCRVFNDFFE